MYKEVMHGVYNKYPVYKRKSESGFKKFTSRLLAKILK